MNSPASLFLSFWKEAHSALSSDRLDAENIECTDSIKQSVNAALEISDGDAANIALQTIIDQADERNPKKRLSLILFIMRMIDKAFAEVHPRSLTNSNSELLQNWILEANDSRRERGTYTSLDDLYLIPRGPLTRNQREELSSYADTLEDRFTYLTAIPGHLDSEGSKIEIRLSPVIDENLAIGVQPGNSKQGHERVCAIPIAEKFDDLVMQPKVRGSRRYLEIAPSSTLNPDQVLLAALGLAGPVDIGLAPEFVMSEDAHAKLKTSLRSSPTDCRLILAGTANTTTSNDGLPWNEAVVTNHYGVELWRQRKIWPSMMDEQRAKSYNIEHNEGIGPYHEHNASGSYIQIVDIDSVGRCVILICQDVVSNLAENLLKYIQPDWVFVPILDRGFAEKSWFVDRARNLARVSKARLIGICSSALPRNDGQESFSLSILGSSDGEFTGDTTNGISFVKAKGNPGFAVHHFGKDKLKKISNLVK